MHLVSNYIVFFFQGDLNSTANTVLASVTPSDGQHKNVREKKLKTIPRYIPLKCHLEASFVGFAEPVSLRSEIHGNN